MKGTKIEVLKIWDQLINTFIIWKKNKNLIFFKMFKIFEHISKIGNTQNRKFDSNKYA